MRLVEVEWIDSTNHGTGPWFHVDEVRRSATEDGALRCWSAGYLVCEDEAQLTIALGHNGDDNHVCEPMTIPRVAVTAIHDLRRDVAPVVLT